MKHGNVIVGQSGGPTSVINSSLAGVFKTARDRGANKIYGMVNGIQGFLDKKYVDLSEETAVYFCNLTALVKYKTRTDYGIEECNRY